MSGRSNRSRSVLDTQNLGLLPAAHLSAAEFDAIIVVHGTSGELHRAMLCPCIRLDTRTPALDCRDCRGLGRIYPKHMREELIFLDTQRSTTIKLTHAGHMPAGTISVTFPSGIIPGWGDRIVPDGEEHIVEELLFIEGSNRVNDSNLRPLRISPDQVKPALTRRNERLLYPRPCCVEAVAYRRGAKTVFATENEYHIEPNGTFIWKPGNGPEPGDAFSIRYRAPAVYVVHTAVPRFRHEADQRMPHNVTATRLDKFAAEDLRDE